MKEAVQDSGIGGHHVQAAAGDDIRWHAVLTRPFAESCAVSHLERQGYQIFYPRYRKLVRHARRRTSVFAPLFPCYLFLKLDASRDRWHSINGTRGVVRLLAQGDVPSVIPHGIVEALQANADADGVMNRMPSLGVGQAVRVAEGPFEDFVGTLERLDGAGRVRVLLDFLGCSVSVALHGETVVSAA